MTNYEKVIRMSPEEMAEIIMCPRDEDCANDDKKESCEACCLRWLNEECTDTAEDKLVAAKARLMGAVVNFMNDIDQLMKQCES